MAKNNNKGFSLVEIILAIAILSILLTPIIRQFANTLETSRKAKTVQEANETAVYEVEMFQSYSKEKLEQEFGTPVTKADLPVTLYSPSGTSIGTMTYNAYVYTLPDAEVGAKKEKFSNAVILDDLSNKVRAYGGEGATTHYKVAYGLTQTDLAAVGGDFELTNEGTIVEYDADGFIKGIVCTDTNSDGSAVSYVQNPNDVNLGNMHDLDKNSVALIMGGTSSYDSQAFTALFSKAMEHLRELDYDSWQQALVNVDNESILSQDTLSNSQRLIKIYTDKQTDVTTGKEYYIVKVDVYYDYSYTLASTDGIKTQTYRDMVTYTVFSQKFFTKQPPEIYFEYQPYCISGTAGANVVYNENDYILFDNYVDECKLYMYKPYRDQQNAGASLDDYYKHEATDSTGNTVLVDGKPEYYTYTTTAGGNKKVKIHLASKHNNTKVQLGADQKPIGDSQYKRIYIFTNLDVSGFETNDANSQFVSDAYDTKFRFVKGEKETAQDVARETDAVYPKYALGTSYLTEMPTGEGTTFQKGLKVLYTLSEDTRESERLYTVTVRLTPDANNKDRYNDIRLSGAKGAN